MTRPSLVMPRFYPALVASLPHVPHFSARKPAPLTRLRLDQRLAQLHPTDRAQILRGESLAAWSPARGLLRFHGSDAGINEVERIASASLADGLRGPCHPGIRNYLELRRDQRLFLMVFRLRRQGHGPEVLQGLDPGFLPPQVALHLRAHWQEADLSLASRHPWLPAVRALLEEGAALDLRHLLMESAWTRLGQLRDLDPFGLPAVAAWFFRWQIHAAWAGHDPLASRARFRQILDQSVPA